MKKFSCDACGKEYTSKPNLQNHKKISRQCEIIKIKKEEQYSDNNL